MTFKEAKEDLEINKDEFYTVDLAITEELFLLGIIMHDYWTTSSAPGVRYQEHLREKIWEHTYYHLKNTHDL